MIIEVLLSKYHRKLKRQTRTRKVHGEHCRNGKAEKMSATGFESVSAAHQATTLPLPTTTAKTSIFANHGAGENP